MASKRLRALSRITRGAMGRGCGREGRGALPLPRAAVISTRLRVREGGGEEERLARGGRRQRIEERIELEGEGGRLGVGLGIGLGLGFGCGFGSGSGFGFGLGLGLGLGSGFGRQEPVGLVEQQAARRGELHGLVRVSVRVRDRV